MDLQETQMKKYHQTDSKGLDAESRPHCKVSEFVRRYRRPAE